MARIGILGGTFNPIHLGHLLAGRSAAEAFGLDKVLVLPCNVSPFKIGANGLAPNHDRLNMVRLSVAEDPLFEACDLDIERGGISYALDTVTLLSARYPQDQLFFIIGMDSLRELNHWHRVSDLFDLCGIITVERPGHDARQTVEKLDFPQAHRERLMSMLVTGRSFDVSSSEIRRRIADGKTIRYLVTDAVEKYIRAQGLYLS